MKCPLKFRLMQFEGGCECDPECAWRTGDACAIARKPVYVVKLAGVRRRDEIDKIRRQAERVFAGERFVVVDGSVDDVYSAEEGKLE